MPSNCKYCGKEIDWKKDGPNNIPVNLDGSLHKPTCKSNGSTIMGRISEYEGSNVHISGKILFIPTEYRRIWQEKYPVGTAVCAAFDKGTCKGMDILTGPNLEKFLKEEEAQRNQQPPPETKPPAAQQPVAQQDRTSPMSAPAERKKGPIEENRMPTREEMLAMVYNYDTYWKAKTLMDIQAREDIRQQVEWKNWQEALGLAIEYEGDNTNLTALMKDAEEIHAFIRGKVKAGGMQ